MNIISNRADLKELRKERLLKYQEGINRSDRSAWPESAGFVSAQSIESVLLQEFQSTSYKQTEAKPCLIKAEHGNSRDGQGRP
jgi:hypothetical protein